MMSLEILNQNVSTESQVSADAIEFKVADSQDELEQSYRMVYKAYVAKGFFAPHPSEMRVGIYNMLPETRTFVAKKDNAVLMTLTLIPDSVFGLPMDAIYNIELDFLRYYGRKIAELSGLAVHNILKGKGMFMFLNLVKLVYFYAKNKDIDDFCIAINPKHQSFYDNILLFEYLGDEKPYPRVQNFPACGRRLNLHGLEERYRARNKHLYSFLFRQKRPFPQVMSENIVLDDALCSFLDRRVPIEQIREFYHLPCERLCC
ncbi:MAG: hypothetical protein AB1487_06710 [Thermodesulfobacteriota bacterium]